MYKKEFIGLMKYCGLGFTNISTLLCAKSDSVRDCLVGNSDKIRHKEVGDWIYYTHLEDQMNMEPEHFYSKYIMWCKTNNQLTISVEQFNNYKFLVLLATIREDICSKL